MDSPPALDTSANALFKSSNVPMDEQKSSYQKLLGKLHDFLESSINRPYVRDTIGHRPSNIMRDYPQAPNNYVWCFSAKYPAWPRTYLSNWSSEEKTACLDAMKNGDLRIIDLSFIRMELSANEGDMHTDAHDLEEGNENQLDEHKAVKNDDKKKDMKSSAMPQDKQLCLYQKCIGKLHVLVENTINRPYVFKGAKRRWTDIVNDHPHLPNAYRWIFSTQYQQFPEKFPSLWSARECHECVEAINKGWLYVEALSPDEIKECSSDSVDKSMENSTTSGLTESCNGVREIKSKEEFQEAAKALKTKLRSDIQRHEFDDIISYYSVSTAALKTEISGLKKQIANQIQCQKKKLMEYEEEITDIIEVFMQADEEREEAIGRIKKLHALEVKLLRKRLKKHGDMSMNFNITRSLRELKQQEKDNQSNETDGDEDSETASGSSSARKRGRNEENEVEDEEEDEDKDTGEETEETTPSPLVKRHRLNEGCM